MQVAGEEGEDGDDEAALVRRLEDVAGAVGPRPSGDLRALVARLERLPRLDRDSIEELDKDS